MPQTTVWGGVGGGNGSGGGAAGRVDPVTPYEFSLGPGLGALPVVRAALLVLRWLDRPLGASEITWLLTSGFLAGSAADQMALARLDREMRQAGERPEVGLGWLLGREWRNLPGTLRTRLLRAQARCVAGRRGGGAGSERRASYGYWAELAASLLMEAGWPGYREADSFTFQAEQRWTRLLGELAELGFDGTEPSWAEFLRTLGTEAGSVIFAAESVTPPVQVLGAFESSGQSFDAVWFLGADDTHWPAVGRLHPLLPGWLQREAKMPHAAPETDWTLAEEATARIVRSAPVVVLSYPREDQGMALRVSPLLLAHAGREVAEPVVGRGAPRLRWVGCERVEDEPGQLAWPEERTAGGAEVLKRQAACAFQSFAVLRLGARRLEEASLGLDAKERGIQMHAVLERLWAAEGEERGGLGGQGVLGGSGGGLGRLRTREDLRRAIGEGVLEAMVARHIQAWFAPLLAAAGDDRWMAAYLGCEQQRLKERLLGWLEWERDRQPFTVVALEKEVDGIRVGGLRLKVRIDRVDRLADETHLLLDYKTGKVGARAWMGRRPEEPQLPLYALFGGVAEVSGVGFAQIRADGTRLLVRAVDPAGMVSERLGSASDRNRLDDAVREAWREALLALAEEFMRGEARVNPRNGRKTCAWCPLEGLCRVHASGLGMEEDDEGLEDDE